MLPDWVGGRFRVERELGRGGMGAVYLAREEGRAGPVALKVLLTRTFSEAALRHFEQEFRTLTSLSHPNLTEVYDFGRVSLESSGRQVPYFTMEYVEGENLARWFQRTGPGWPRLYEALAQVGQALAYLHARGLVHRDVKSSNILVGQKDGALLVKLMDLGLAGSTGTAGGAGTIRGTVAYLAPEAARGGAVDPRSDLYSLGCVAYEAVAGRPPFQGTSALGVLRGHLQEEPISPSTFNRAVPREFEELILKLLSKDPGRRVGSADRFLDALNRVAGGALEIRTPEVRKHRVLGSGFVGREGEAARLAAALDEARRGAGKLVLVVGEAGIGKSRLLREFQVRCQIEGWDLFLGRPEGGRSAFAEALAAAVRSRGPLSDETIERHGAILETLLGVPLGRPREEGPAEPAGHDPFALVAAVMAALDEIGRPAPVVLAVEDLHLADETTCLLLRHAARGLSAAGPTDAGAARPILLLGTYRGDEVSRSSPLFDLLSEGRDEGAVEEVFLDPLPAEAVGGMLRAMLGTEEIPPAFLDRILETTRGNPLFVSETVALLAEEGLVDPGAGTPPDAGVLSRVEVPRRVRDLVARRLSRVGAEALGVLRAAAVLGGPGIDADAVSAVTGTRWEHVVRHLQDLVAGGLVAVEEDEEGTPLYRAALPGLMGLAVESLDPEEGRLLHARAISYLERRGLPRQHAAFAALARHAESAGLPGKAVEALSRAAELAAELHAHHESIGLLSRAIEILLRQPVPPGSALSDLYARRGGSHARIGDLQRAEEDFRWMLARAERDGNALLKARARILLGDVLSDRGQYAEAQENLDVALEVATRLDDRRLASAASAGLGRIAAKTGQFEEGAAHFERAARLASEAQAPSLAAEALLERGKLHREQGNFRLSLACFEQAEETAGPRAPAAVRSAIEEGSALALEVQGKPREAIEAYARARDRARERGDARAVASLTASLGAVHRKAGNHDAARGEIEEALASHRRLGSREGMVLGLQELSLLHRDQGRYGAALDTAEESLRLARRIARKDLTAVSLNLIGGIHLRAGDLENAGPRLEEAQRIAREIRSQRLLAVFLLDLGDLERATGRAGEARRHCQESAFLARKVGDRRLEALAMIRLGEAHLLDNEFDRALVSCRKAQSLVEVSGLPLEEADVLLLRARAELARPGGDVVRAEIDAAEALGRYRDLRDAERLWQAEHLAARAAMRLGRRDEAASRVDRAHRFLEGMRSQLAGRWRETFLEDARRRELYEDWERLRAEAPREAAVTPEGLPAGGEFARLREEAGRLKRLLDVNRTLASTRNPTDLLRAILDAATELTGAERGFLMLRDGEEVATSARSKDARGGAGDGAAEPSRSIARQVIESGEPILAADAETDERLAGFESVRDLKIRSVLAVPLRIRERVEGAVYLDNRLERGVFSPADQEMAARLADQAAIALETARLVARVESQNAELERLNRELERTVAEQRAEIRDVREELVSSRSSLELRYRFDDLVGASPRMLRVYHIVERVAPKRLPVLIVGESGTGKELIARAIHTRSDRASGPFFTVNCAALTETLLESELFGYRRGAFTGADRDKPGYFELASGGTLFLDEIGDMGLAMQAKLLRALQEGEVLPVGGKSPVRVDVRIVSATNKDLPALIREGRFREDLYYRIHVARVEVPPLRARREDIPLLVDHFLGLLADEEKEPKRTIEPEALKRLIGLDWPGNVRELQHLLLRAAMFAKGPVLTARDLERYGDLPAPGPASLPAPAGSGEVDSLEALERKQVLLALTRAGGNKTRAAELLGINRATLFRKLRRYGL